MKYSKSLIVSGLLVLAAGMTACGGESTPEAMPPEVPPAEPPPAPEPPPETTGGEAAGASSIPPEPPPPPAPEPLTDEQIAAVTDAANTGEVEQAKLAQKKGKNARVKKFAATMIAHHGQAKQKQSKLLGKAKITPAENALSTQLTEESTRMLETLKTAEGPDFDKAYIDSQVDAHQKVLEAFDTRLIPNAQNPELKASLEEFRTKIEAHLKEAQEIQQLLAAAPAGAGAGASGTKGSGATGASPAGGAGTPSGSKGTGAGTSTGSGAGTGTGSGAGAGSGSKPAPGGSK
jgi:putative membrane protein